MSEEEKEDKKDIVDEKWKDGSVQYKDSKGRYLAGNPGGGRRKGSKPIMSKESARKLSNMGADPLEFLAEIMMDEGRGVSNRIRAAEKIIEYAYSKQPLIQESKVETNLIPQLVLGVKEDTVEDLTAAAEKVIKDHKDD